MKSETVVDPSLLTSSDSPSAQQLKKPALEKITSLRRAFAWQLARSPLDKHVIWESARIHLPRSYLAKDGEDLKSLRAGCDVNQVVHQHYVGEIDPRTNVWVNFVHADKIAARR